MGIHHIQIENSTGRMIFCSLVFLPRTDEMYAKANKVHSQLNTHCGREAPYLYVATQHWLRIKINAGALFPSLADRDCFPPEAMMVMYPSEPLDCFFPVALEGNKFLHPCGIISPLSTVSLIYPPISTSASFYQLEPRSLLWMDLPLGRLLFG